MVMATIPEQWAQRAQYDLDTAKAMLAAGQYVYVLFCFQQAVEKALKALILKRSGKMSPRSHNPPKLPEIAELQIDTSRAEFLLWLTVAYVRSRYPDSCERLPVARPWCRSRRAEPNGGDMRMADDPADAMSRAERAVCIVARHLDVSAAFFFGSQADGMADADSDIDIAVFAPGIEAWDFVKHVDTAARIQMELDKDIELHSFRPRPLSTASRPALPHTSRNPASGWMRPRWNGWGKRRQSTVSQKDEREDDTAHARRED